MANELTIASLPEVTVANELTIASLPEVTVANELTIASLPEVTVANELTIASLPEITVANELTIASLPEITVANELTIASLPAIELSGTPTVVFDQPVEITTGTSNFAVQLAARTVTADVSSYTFTTTSSTTTPVYYVAELRDFGYMVFSTATVVTAEIYASPVPTGVPAVSLYGPEDLLTFGVILPQGYVTGAYLPNVGYSQYSYVVLSVSTDTPVTVDVYFQGQI
ncbi:Uncharacterised protein [Turicibacter sanguinis]|nr:Uncharacterised protein [Turicibacter sanguinis]